MTPLNAGLFLEAEHQLLAAIRPRHQLSALTPKFHFLQALPTVLNHHVRQMANLAFSVPLASTS
jgi:hypothetical protein